MFDRFSENAKMMMKLARDAANRHLCSDINAEHLLIGILEMPKGHASTTLTAQGIDIASLHTALDSLLPRGSEPQPKQLTLSPTTKRILEQAMTVAADLGHNHINDQHVLLGILRDHDNDAKNVLLRVGADPDTIQSAMTASIPTSQRSRVNMLLISNSTMHGGGYLEHCAAEIKDFLGDRKRVMFVPYALADHEGYAQKASEAFAAMGHDLDSVHRHDKPSDAIDGADAVFIGGGNTFRLLAALTQHDLISAIQKRAFAGMPYMGSSAGTNVATLSIRTTNDMPIVQPPSFTALQLVPFQINPHYLDPDPSSAHMGETRAERIQQFHEEHEVPVLGLREGCMLRITGPNMQLRGTTNARLFRRAQEPEEFQPPCDMSSLLDECT